MKHYKQNLSNLTFPWTLNSSVIFLCCWLFRAKSAKNTYSTQEFGSDHWMEPNMVAHGQIRNNPQFEMQENGSKQNLLNPGNEVGESHFNNIFSMFQINCDVPRKSYVIYL